MNYPVYTNEPSIRYPKHTKELDSLIQTAPTAKKKLKTRKPPFLIVKKGSRQPRELLTL